MRRWANWSKPSVDQASRRRGPARHHGQVEEWPTAERIVALLADGDRLRVAAALVLGADTIAELAEATAMPASRVGGAVARLMQGGLVERDRYGLRLKEEVLRSLARTAADRDEDSCGQDVDQPRAGLRAFVKDGQLLSIPSSHTKRLQVLDLIVQDFDIGVRYSEARVSEMLARWHPDYAALRRYLVDEGFLERDGGGGRYWRAGGSVDL
jgi:hypothetical protein